MEIKLKDWILQERALGVCICGFVIRVKALEISSQLGLSPRTLINKRRALARDLEKKLISKCAAKHLLERPPTTSGATSSNRVAATSSRGRKEVEVEVLVVKEVVVEVLVVKEVVVGVKEGLEHNLKF